MPLLKRKPVIYQPLPSLSTILQPLASSSKEPINESTPPPPLGQGAGGKSKKSKKVDAESEIGDDPSSSWVPPDCEDDVDQLRLLSRVFEEGFTNGAVTKGKKAGTWIVNGSVNIHPPPSSESENGDGKDGLQNGNGVKEEDAKMEEAAANEGGGGEMLPPPAPTPAESWKITDREVYYIPETGEIFTEYE
jgi:bromodomain adjacent to zinc finger domain protein 1A